DGDGYTNVEEYLNATDPTRSTSGGPSVQSEPFVQKGNDALRFDVARTAQEWTPHDPVARLAFVDAVEASGQEVGDYVGLDFTRLPAGDFVKGYSGANITVTLTKAFEMATYEVTQGQWTAVMGGKPWLDREWAQDAPENAATYVSWHDCQEFVARLNACGDREYRLPTEAELDYASRAGHDGTAMFWLSDEQIGDHAWYGRNTVRAGEKYAHPVGRKEPSPWGVHDLAGNALEWCYDQFEYRYWGRGETKTDPMGPEGDASIRDYYVVRGGSFYYSARLIRTEYDRSNDIDPSKAHRATYRNFDVGFRVVRVSP
ncbi:MAG: SUMF1/EgtB/PvdO family nonheme iron enzyme, partial [Candidatus Poribacteria bacterium]